MRSKIFSLAVTIAVLAGMASTARADYKIRQRTMVSDQKIENTIYVKGSRQRSETSGMMGMGADVATIEQCDLRRNVMVNDNKKLYFIEPFASGNDVEASASMTGKLGNSKTTRGGTVTTTFAITDTGERKQMFGLTARHIKSTMTTQSSADACDKVDTKMETDGWYVDLPQFSCPWQPASTSMQGGAGRGGCQDRAVMKQTGTGKIGFPLQLTQTLGDSGMTQTIETIELTSAPLDAALFDVPKGYQLAANSQDLYGKPDIGAIMRARKNGDEDSSTSKTNDYLSQRTAPSKKPGTIRIGILMPSNKTSESVSPDNLQSYLISKLTGGNVEAVALSSESAAKSLECDYVLSTDVTRLKQSAAGKVGGMFGKVTGTDTSGIQKFEAQIDYRLTTADGAGAAQNKAVQKADGAEAAAMKAIDSSIRDIMTAAQKK
jgi:hypothetical protein